MVYIVVLERGRVRGTKGGGGARPATRNARRAVSPRARKRAGWSKRRACSRVGGRGGSHAVVAVVVVATVVGLRVIVRARRPHPFSSVQRCSLRPQVGPPAQVPFRRRRAQGV